ncbi:NUDIX hydrolase [Neisseria lisongii]|uniref:CoA pyrophosphatase n=1 Tax=Neisseria lisongii TaxID=2912188 RepID=A0AAW5ALU1_9NEIS|nr:CoA pyrophosphatase [Neisseria lisongii]MCF7529445.1 CoA pyrophosphatase [Neisseria lisongii]
MNAEKLSDFLIKAADYASPTQLARNGILDIENRWFKQAAVLLACVYHQQQWQIVLTRRSASLRHHGGQIALAGGGREGRDVSLTATALRETAEEIGIAAHEWQTFPVLPPDYTPSGYEVYAVPALCRRSPKIEVNAAEVAEVFYLPLALALNPENYRSRVLNYNGKSIDSPVLPYRDYDIWGLTAVILYGLAERYRAYCAAALE